MKSALSLALAGLIMFFVVMAASSYDDPFGITTRVRIQEDGAIQRTAIRAEADKFEALQGTAQAGIWAGTVPLVVGIIVAGLLVAIILHYRGRAHIISLQQSVGTLPAPSQPKPPAMVVLEAQRRNALPVPIDGQWALVRDNQIVAWVVPRETRQISQR